MSAIYGKLYPGSVTVTGDDLRVMEKALNHWSADDSGTWHNQQVGMGHLMLYNTPESLHEKLPFYDSYRKIAITADARIDNREELFQKLSLPKTDTHLTADSILILEAYAHWGKDCVKHLIGDFAFAIFDEREQKLFCARDHMGVKPFFYYHDEHFFAFASEKKGLLAIDGIDQTISQTYSIKLAGNIQPHVTETFYEHIVRLAPAHTLSLQAGKITLKKYWELDTASRLSPGELKDYLATFRQLFSEAIRCRLRSAYLVSTELSGGLDSSGITCVAADLLHSENKKLASFSFAGTDETNTYPGKVERDNEFIDAVHLSAKIDKPVKLFESGYQGWQDEIELLLFVHDGPEFCNTGWSLPLKKQAAATGSKTVLSGYGGDEVVTNYTSLYFLEDLAENRIMKYARSAKKQGHSVLGITKLLLITKFKKTTTRLLGKTWLRREIKKLKNSPRNFLTPDFTEKIDSLVRPPVVVLESMRNIHKILVEKVQQTLRLETETLSGYHYRIETRFPMVDIRLMQYVVNLPADLKIQYNESRLLFRNAMRGIVPDMILDEVTYSGYSIPFAVYEWVNSQGDKQRFFEKLRTQDIIPAFLNMEKLSDQYSFKIDDTKSIYISKVQEIEMLLLHLYKKRLKDVDN